MPSKRAIPSRTAVRTPDDAKRFHELHQMEALTEEHSDAPRTSHMARRQRRRSKGGEEVSPRKEKEAPLTRMVTDDSESSTASFIEVSEQAEVQPEERPETETLILDFKAAQTAAHVQVDHRGAVLRSEARAAPSALAS